MSNSFTSTRRSFLTGMAGAFAAVMALPAMALAQGDKSTTGSAMGKGTAPDVGEGPYELPPLPYSFNALDPVIDAQTMEIHHDKHHAGYVKNLNQLVQGKEDLARKTPEALMANLDAVPSDIRTKVRNNAGGHMNHTMFWDIMTPGGAKQPSGELAKAIEDAFGTLDEMKKKFNEAGTGQFGSGWAWLVVPKGGGKLQITSTPNQDNPIMEGHKAILGNDVWEHAYYLKYQNKRGEYLNNWWNIVNWDKVAERYEKAKG